MKLNSFLAKSILVFAFSLIFVLIGCEQTKETVEDTTNKVKKNTGELVQKTADKVEEITEKNLKEVNDEMKSFVEDKFLVGTWTGKFDNRKTTLVITKQEDNKIEGKITINYRQVINQEVKGSYDPEINKLFMEDQLHSRYKGKYEGQLDDDKSTFSGIFTMSLDGKKFNFNLSKK